MIACTHGSHYKIRTKARVSDHFDHYIFAGYFFILITTTRPKLFNQREYNSPIDFDSSEIKNSIFCQ